MIIAVGGSDNCGKTTQLAWLRHVCGVSTLPGVHHFSPPLASMTDSAAWWFETSSTTEHVHTLSQAAVQRDEAAGAMEGLVLLDRGWHTLTAACAATAMLKDDLDANTAIGLVRSLLPPARQSHSEILLRLSADPSEQAEMSLRRERNELDNRYRRYQRALAATLAVLAEEGCFEAIIDCNDRPIFDLFCDLTATLRRIAPSYFTHSIHPGMLRSVVALGGMSESGKTTAAEYLLRLRGYTRLKIAHLTTTAAKREKIPDAYSLTSDEQAGLVGRELVMFGLANKSADFVVDSLHQFDSIESLRRILGSRLRVIYIDVGSEQRRKRALVSIDELASNDLVKRSRGADRIRTISDQIIDNSGTFVRLQAALDRAQFLPLDGLRASRQADHVSGSIREPLRRIATKLHDTEGLHLLTLTGSGNTDSWIAGWSDVDLLVVGGEESSRAVWKEVNLIAREMPGVKWAVTEYTPEEVASLWVSGAAIHALRLLGEQKLLPLIVGADHRLPWVSARVDADRAIFEIPTVAFRLRRLIALSTGNLESVRSLYKHVILLLKLVLRVEGVDAETVDDVIRSCSRFHGLELAIPGIREIVSDAGFAHSRVHAAAVRVLIWYNSELRGGGSN